MHIVLLPPCMSFSDDRLIGGNMDPMVVTTLDQIQLLKQNLRVTDKDLLGSFHCFAAARNYPEKVSPLAITALLLQVRFTTRCSHVVDGNISLS